MAIALLGGDEARRDAEHPELGTHDGGRLDPPVEQRSDLVVGEQFAPVLAHRCLADRDAESSVDIDQLGEKIAFEVWTDAVDERRMTGPHRLIRHASGHVVVIRSIAGTEGRIEHRRVDVGAGWTGERCPAVDEDDVA